MQLEAVIAGSHLDIRVPDARLDAAVAIQFKDRFRELLGDEVESVTLDLSGVEFLDSSGLGAVVAVMKYAGPERRFALTGLTPPVRKVFKLTRMDTVFRIEDATPGPGAADVRPA